MKVVILPTFPKETKDRTVTKQLPTEGVVGECGLRVTTAWKMRQATSQQKFGKPKEEYLKRRPESYANVYEETHSSEKELE